jgi:hypothetical protein
LATKKPSSTEEEYFAREEAKRKELSRIRREQEEAAAAREARRGWCPRGCDSKLVEEAFRSIVIDRCPECRGVWLDPGELEKVSSEDAGAVRSVFNFFAGRSG